MTVSAAPLACAGFFECEVERLSSHVPELVGRVAESSIERRRAHAKPLLARIIHGVRSGSSA